MTFETNKPVVHYSEVSFMTFPGVEIPSRAFVATLDHPVLGKTEMSDPACTSEIINYDETTGIFETKNTVYVPEGA